MTAGTNLANDLGVLSRLPVPLAVLLTFLFLGAACDEAVPALEPAYLGSSADRRAALEDALWQPELPYSQSLLTNYGFGDSGWDLLPTMNVAVRPFRAADAEALGAGQIPVFDPLDPTVEVVGDAEDVGEQVFTKLPMRYDTYIAWILSKPAQWSDYGIAANADGTLPGVVVYADTRGDTQVGVTCAFCHGSEGVAGRASRTLDLGRARGDFLTWRGVADVDRFYGWGPGRIDVTDDPMDSPTAIPDLWSLAEASYLNHSGVIRLPQNAPEAAATTMAVRFETQFIMGHRMRSRPPRDLMWALATFVRGLEPPATGTPKAAEEQLVAKGSEVFERQCASCHVPKGGFSGGLISAALLPLDQAVAETPERGTSFYKVPSLRGVANNGPYFHDGSAPDLTTLVADGHPFGDPVPADERDALLTFLSTL